MSWLWSVGSIKERMELRYYAEALSNRAEWGFYFWFLFVCFRAECVLRYSVNSW